MNTFTLSLTYTHTLSLSLTFTLSHKHIHSLTYTHSHFGLRVLQPSVVEPQMIKFILFSTCMTFLTIIQVNIRNLNL